MYKENRLGTENVKSLLFSNKVFAVFLAEPISDIIAVTVTAILFYRDFSSTLRRMPSV